MKILHIIISLKNGGAENLLVDLVNLQVKKNNVSIIIIKDEIENSLLARINSNVKIISINRKSSKKRLKNLIKLNFCYLLAKPDVVHFHNPLVLRNILFKKLYKKIITVHDVGLSSKYYKYFNKLIAISNIVKKDIKLRSQFDSEVVYNGINFNMIEMKKDFILKQNIKILQVSRLIHQKKGQDLLIKTVYNLLKKEDTKIDIQLYFIGEGGSLEYLEDIANRYEINKNVHFMGNKSREYIYKNLKNYDILVQPSRYEGFGLTILEGVCAKLPVIASNIDGPNELKNILKNLFLFEVDNEKSLEFEIRRVIQLFELNKIKSVCENNYSYLIQNFSINRTVENYNYIYKSL